MDIVARLGVFIELFDARGATPGPVLLIGADGMGKATLAMTVSNESDVGFLELDAATIERDGDLTKLLLNIKEKQVLLLTNIQLLRKKHIRRLRRVMQESSDEVVIGSGRWQRTHIAGIDPFTFIATCPRRSDCPGELLADFSLALIFQPYSFLELEALAKSIGETARISLEPGAAALIARSCDGRPANVESILRRVARAINRDTLTEEDVVQALTAFGIPMRPESYPDGVASVENLSGQDFEKLIAVLLAKMGFQTEMTKTTGDGGIDIIARLDKPILGGRYLFQCKRFAQDNLVGASTVRDFCGAVTADRPAKGIFITTSNFTVQAREFGERAGIELIEGILLEKLLAEYRVMDSSEVVGPA